MGLVGPGARTSWLCFGEKIMSHFGPFKPLFWLGLVLLPVACAKAPEDTGKEDEKADITGKMTGKTDMTAKTDITAQARNVNSQAYQAPPTKFRPGHVTARSLDGKAVRKTETGFSIRLPRGAPVPTP